MGWRTGLGQVLSTTSAHGRQSCASFKLDVGFPEKKNLFFYTNDKIRKSVQCFFVSVKTNVPLLVRSWRPCRGLTSHSSCCGTTHLVESTCLKRNFFLQTVVVRRLHTSKLMGCASLFRVDSRDRLVTLVAFSEEDNTKQTFEVRSSSSPFFSCSKRPRPKKLKWCPARQSRARAQHQTPLS